jgi:hypothetical protein
MASGYATTRIYPRELAVIAHLWTVAKGDTWVIGRNSPGPASKLAAGKWFSASV